MTPSEKAHYIVNSIYQPLGELSCNVSSRKMWEYAKRRAKEFIDMMLDTPVIWYSKEASDRNDEEAPRSGTEEYWIDVKDEIDNL